MREGCWLNGQSVFLHGQRLRMSCSLIDLVLVKLDCERFCVAFVKLRCAFLVMEFLYLYCCCCCYSFPIFPIGDLGLSESSAAAAAPAMLEDTENSLISASSPSSACLLLLYACEELANFLRPFNCVVEWKCLECCDAAAVRCCFGRLY